jgi:hypothetical protein
MSDAVVHWQLEASNAKLRCGPLEADVEFDPLGVVFMPAGWHDAKIKDVLLRVSSGPHGRAESRELSEVYVRGNDLVATYARSAQQRIAPQLYLRAAQELGGVAHIEMVLSVNTDLLDSQPESWVSCALLAELFHATNLSAPRFQKIVADPLRLINSAASREHLFVLRRRDRIFSYAQMAHPTDFVSASIVAGEVATVFLKLFPERLEKGVIRRGRVCGWFLPVENDLASAVELARQFVDEPLPLTA